jgi:hypothetical protein
MVPSGLDSGDMAIAATYGGLTTQSGTLISLQ